MLSWRPPLSRLQTFAYHYATNVPVWRFVSRGEPLFNSCENIVKHYTGRF